MTVEQKFETIDKAVMLLEYLHDVSDSTDTRKECRDTQDDLRLLAMDLLS